MGRIKKTFAERLLELPEAAAMVEHDKRFHYQRCLANALRNYGKPESERALTPLISERTYQKLALLQGLNRDSALRARLSKIASKPRKQEFTLKDVLNLVDEWSDRMQINGNPPDRKGWKKFVYKSLGFSEWRMVNSRIQLLGVSESDLINRMRSKNSEA